MLAASDPGRRVRADVFTRDVEAVWSLLVRVAGSDPIPQFEPGPYTSDRHRAALARVVAWCASRGSAATGSATGSAPARRAVKGKNIDARMMTWHRDHYEESLDLKSEQ